jgi:hypothetical protein
MNVIISPTQTLPPTLYNQHTLSWLLTTVKYKLITLDIENLYVNTPIKETIKITKYFLRQNNIDQILQQQILHTLHTILHQNYFRFDDKSYKLAKRVAMGSTIAGLITHIFLQHFEKLTIKHIIESWHSTWKNRYFDYILII